MELLTKIFLVFLFLAIYFFSFFILVALHNRKKIFYSPKPNKKYSISFLVPAYNEEDTIQDTIQAIFKSEYPVYEVIAVNDGSKDKTAEKIRELMPKYPRLKILDKKNSGKADSLNQGIKMARGELIAIVDADSYPNEDAVGNMVGFFNDKKVGAVTSCVMLKNRNTFFEKIQEIEYIVLAWTRKLFDFVDSVYVTNGPLSIYRRNILNNLGGFDKKSITEDIEITWHILSEGYKTRMALNALVYTTAPNKFRRWWRQRVRWGIGGIETIFKYKKDFFRNGMFGGFIIPYVSLTIFLSVLGFIFGVYLIARDLSSRALYTGYSASMQSTIFRFENINTSPTIIFVILAILFVMSYSYSSIVFRTMKQNHILGARKVFNRLFYMLIYLTLYPAVWFDAIYRVIKREHKW